jgi:hypothetical protein
VHPNETIHAYGLILEASASGERRDPPPRRGGGRQVPVVLHDGPAPPGFRPLHVPPWFHAQAGYATDAGGRVLVRFPDGPAFVVGAGAIEAFDARGVSSQELRWYLLGPVTTLLLRLRGRLLLHASAVSVGGRTVAFAGPAGAGKSTLAATLVARGARGVTDDLLVVERAGGDTGTWLARPGPSRHLLWPDSAAALAGSAAGGEAALRAPNPCRWDKRAVPSIRWSDPQVPVPLDELLLLAPAAADAAPSRRPCSPGRAVATLLSSLHTPWLGDARRRRTDLEGTAALVDALGVRELTVPRELDRLPEVAELVESPAQEAMP